MKKLLLFCAVFATIFLFAAEPAKKESDVFNFLGFSLRQPGVARYHMREFMDYNTQKMQYAPGTVKTILAPPPNIALTPEDYLFYSFGFFAFGDSRDTYGIRFSLSETNGKATDTGLNLSLTFSELEQMNGIQTAVYGGKVKTLYGLQLFPIYAIADKIVGAQFAGVTMMNQGGGITATLVAIAKEEFTGLHCTVTSATREFNGIMLSGAVGESFRMKGVQICGIGASTKETMHGVQISGLASHAKTANGVQFGGYGNLSETLNGVQFGCWNKTDDLTGVQFGVFNQAKKSAKGVQFGLLNHMEGALVPWFPLFNIKL